MKISFAIPDEVGLRFKKAIPAGQRFAVVTRLLRKKLSPSSAVLEKVCDRVNQLDVLNGEMTQWEKFNDADA